MTNMLHGFRITLREMFFWIAFIGVGCIALKTAQPLSWMSLSGAILLLYMGSSLFAVADRGVRQCWALGFIICAGIYAVTSGVTPFVFSSEENRELTQGSGRLPTSQILGLVYEQVKSTTTEPAPSDDGGMSMMGGMSGMGDMSGMGGMSGMPGGGMPGMSPARVSVKPTTQDFMLVGHSLWLLIFGFVGARVCSVIYLRRTKSGKGTLIQDP